MLAAALTRLPVFHRPRRDRRALATASLVVAALVIVAAWALPERAAAKRTPPTPACPDSRFVVVGEPLIPGAAAAVVGAADAFYVGGGQVTLLGGCGPAPARLRPGRKGTRLRATWPGCPGLRGRVSMRALIDPQCSQVVGTLRAKGYKKPFTAMLRGAVCGDGVVDAGEQCEPPGQDGCDAHCAFEAPVCGDGAVEGTEACDDGNTLACDGCASDCSRTDDHCGDGILECGETCETDADCPSGQTCTGCACVSGDDDRCEEASMCGDRVYCDGAPGCLCIRSAEGPIRCGQLPTTCHVQLCETSADCAALGEGWFCDTPNSGCCSDPPKELPRCIAPCTATTTTTRPPTTTSTRPPTTTTTTPAPTTTSTTLPPGDESIALDPETRRLVAEAGKAAQGLPADYDGDGVPDYVTTITGGTVQSESDADGDGNPEFISTRDAAGNGAVRIDSDSDGRPEVETTTTVGPPPVRVVLRDTDLDGFVDRRETDTFDLAAGTVRVVEESDPEGDGTYVTIADDVVPIGQNSGAPCDPNAGLPGVFDRGSPRLRLNGIVIPVDGGGGRCSRSQGERIAKALDCAFTQGHDCLANTNAGLAKELFDGLVRNDNLMIACGNHCAGSDANTLTGVLWLGATMNVNPDILDGASPVNDADLCTVILHELLHWRGEGLGDQAKHDQGIDRTYSCGRYCGGCTSRGPGAPGPNVDCARCAGTESEKGRCGLKVKEEEIPCPAYELCHAGLAGNRACETCRGLQQQFCDDSNSSAAPLLSCCLLCPAEFPHNDLVCTGDGSKMGTCATKPPECP
jgi:cysteine-rich repeat protein